MECGQLCSTDFKLRKGVDTRGGVRDSEREATELVCAGQEGCHFSESVWQSSGAALQPEGADLSTCSLSGLDLQRANLENEILSKANLREARLDPEGSNIMMKGRVQCEPGPGGRRYAKDRLVQVGLFILVCLSW